MEAILLTRARLLQTIATIPLLAGCSLVSSGEPATSRPAPELDLLRIAVTRDIDSVPLRLAVEQGRFAESGLRVELIEPREPDSGIAMLRDGAADIAFSSDVGLLRAVEQGEPLRVLGEAYTAASETMALLVPPESELTELSDLTWTTVAVDAEGGTGALATRSVLGTAGVAASSVEFEPVPPRRVVDALGEGEIDAAWVAEPLLTVARKELGARVLTYCAAGATESLPLSAYVSTEEFTERNPRTVALFREVLRDAHEDADPSAVRRALPRMVDVDEVTSALVSLGDYPTVANPKRLRRVADLMHDFGLLSRPIDTDSLVPKPEHS